MILILPFVLGLLFLSVGYTFHWAAWHPGGRIDRFWCTVFRR